LQNAVAAGGSFVVDAAGTTIVQDYEKQPLLYLLPTRSRVTYPYNADFRPVDEDA